MLRILQRLRGEPHPQQVGLLADQGQDLIDVEAQANDIPSVSNLPNSLLKENLTFDETQRNLLRHKIDLLAAHKKLHSLISMNNFLVNLKKSAFFVIPPLPFGGLSAWMATSISYYQTIGVEINALIAKGDWSSEEFEELQAEQNHTLWGFIAPPILIILLGGSLCATQTFIREFYQHVSNSHIIDKRIDTILDGQAWLEIQNLLVKFNINFRQTPTLKDVIDVLEPIIEDLKTLDDLIEKKRAYNRVRQAEVIKVLSSDGILKSGVTTEQAEKTKSVFPYKPFQFFQQDNGMSLTTKILDLAGLSNDFDKEIAALSAAEDEGASEVLRSALL